jgi:amino-acid N-acetyltransferase
MEEIVITPAEKADLPQVMALLENSGLPTEGLASHWQNLILAQCEREIAGCAAIEIYGREGLLRSVAVAQAFRGSGIGEKLTRTVLRAAEAHAVSRVYLLTETAGDYFLRFGFRSVDRGLVSEPVKESAEFSGACPDSALAMVLLLED